MADARAQVPARLEAWHLPDAAVKAEPVVRGLRRQRHRPAPGRTCDEGGRGLLLVVQLAKRWGTRHHTGGKTIWAEIEPVVADL
ncbi:ATP-binding protein [Streptomyces sp. NPDC001507]|uniref:ATP-binding protein n=1 Tax=Streptomyces sp. NPDC001507 TaxID=3364579 RepID=UPI00369D4C80